VHKPAAAAAVAEDMVVASAEVTWVASMEAAWTALKAVALEVLVEITSVALAWITWPTWIAITLPRDGVISVVALTITASIARITSHTHGRTPAPTER
jgi:hypothetical protein